MLAKNRLFYILRSSAFTTPCQYFVTEARVSTQSITQNIDNNPSNLNVQSNEFNLTEQQQKRVKQISEAYLALDKQEERYFKALLRRKVERTMGIDLKLIKDDWPEMKLLDKQPPRTEEQTKFEQRLSNLSPLGQKAVSQLFSEIFGTATGGIGGGRAAAQQADTAQQGEAKESDKKAAPVVEKASFELQLTSYDAGQKIKIIKEVRELLKLGLKEAKEMVEKAPVTLKKDVKKEEAEGLKEKLQAAGCVITLL